MRAGTPLAYGAADPGCTYKRAFKRLHYLPAPLCARWAPTDKIESMRRNLAPSSSSHGDDLELLELLGEVRRPISHLPWQCLQSTRGLASPAACPTGGMPFCPSPAAEEAGTPGIHLKG